MAIYTQTVNVLVINGAGSDDTLQNAIKTGFVINADTGRIMINGKEYKLSTATSGGGADVDEEQKAILDELINGRLPSADANDFMFADSDNNVVARIGGEGIRTVGVKITNSAGHIAGTFNAKTCGKIFKFPFADMARFDDNDNFLFTDKNGNVVAKIDAQGIHAVAYYDANGNRIG